MDLNTPKRVERISVSNLKDPSIRSKSVSFSRIWNGDMISSPDYLYAEWTSEETGAVYANILYDLVADPFELNNLASDSSYTAEIRAFERQLDAWIKTTNDLGELPESEIIKYSTQ